MTKPLSLQRPGLLLAIVTVIGAILIGWGIFDFSSESDSTKTTAQNSAVNIPRPEFSLPNLEGKLTSINTWDGKVVAVNFWATWCSPCKREIPLFNELQHQYGTQGLQFVGVALDDAEAVKNYIKTVPLDYPTLVDDEEGITVARNYGNDVGVLPYTAFVDRAGRVAAVQFGEITREEILKIVKPLL